jgi:hypothetical protein
MSIIDLEASIRINTQLPLNAKTYCKVLEDISSLGENNYKAFFYYKGLQVYCASTKQTFIWDERTGEGGYLENQGVLEADYTYPNGSEANGINYSGLNYNFFLINSVNSNLLVEKIISGAVYWVENLDFKSTAIEYVIGNEPYIAPSSVKTLDESDAILNRIDVFAVDTNNELIVITGTPAADPLEPTINFISQLRVAAVYVPAAATSPLEASIDQIYEENLQEPNEWNSSFESVTIVPAGNSEVNFDSTNNPAINTKAIETNDFKRTTVIIFEKDEDVFFENISSLFFRFKNNNVNYLSVTVRLFLESNLLKSITLQPGQNGFNSGNQVYNEVNIPIEQFTSSTLRGVKFNKILFNFKKSGLITQDDEISFNLDDIKLIGGLEGNLEEGSFLSLPDVLENSYQGHANKVPSVNAEETGMEFVEINPETLQANQNVSGTYEIDWINNTYDLTLIGDTTFTEINLPETGIKTKTINLTIIGNFIPTFPADWETFKVGEFKGSDLNDISIRFISAGKYFMRISNSLSVYPAPILGSIVPVSLLPSSTSELRLSGSFFTPAGFVLIDGQVVNTIEFDADTGDYILSVTTGAIEDDFDIVISNGTTITFDSKLIVNLGDVFIPTLQSDWQNITGEIDLETDGFAKVQTKDTEGTAKAFLIPANQDYILRWNMNKSSLEPGPQQISDYVVLALMETDGTVVFDYRRTSNSGTLQANRITYRGTHINAQQVVPIEKRQEYRRISNLTQFFNGDSSQYSFSEANSENVDLVLFVKVKEINIENIQLIFLT